MAFFTTRAPRLGGAVLMGLLAGCATDSAPRGAVRAEPVVETRPRAEELSRFVLVLHEGTDGRVSHEWRPAERFDLAAYQRPSSAREPRGEVVLAAMRPRDCHAELIECVNKCMARPLPRGYGHITRNRGMGATNAYCRDECIQPYRDCEEMQGREPQEFSAMDEAVGWLRDHHRSLLAGSVVVIAGVVFVTVSAGAGLFVLVPAVLLFDRDAVVKPHAWAVLR